MRSRASNQPPAMATHLAAAAVKGGAGPGGGALEQDRGGAAGEAMQDGRQEAGGADGADGVQRAVAGPRHEPAAEGGEGDGEEREVDAELGAQHPDGRVGGGGGVGVDALGGAEEAADEEDERRVEDGEGCDCDGHEFGLWATGYHFVGICHKVAENR